MQRKIIIKIFLFYCITLLLKMYGRKAFKLVTELDLSAEIQPFNEVLVKEVLEEMHAVYDANMVDSNAIRNEDNMALLPSVQLRHIALTRNKRCVLAYIYNRMRKLRELRWELGSILPPEINTNLLNAEVQWFQSYNKSLATYMRSLGEDQGFNLTANMLPPKTPYVEVRCMVDFGKLELEDGQVILLKKNTYHLLPRAVCEPLIRQVLGTVVAEHFQDTACTRSIMPFHTCNISYREHLKQIA